MGGAPIERRDVEGLLIRLALAILLLAAASTFALGDPKQAAVHSRQGKAYFEAKQYDQAVSEFKKAYELDRSKPVTLFKIASSYYAKADYASAIEYYGKYLAADPEGPLAQQALEFTTIANKALAEVRAKQEAEAKAKADAEAKAKLDAEAERKRIAAASHLKQAEAYAQTGAWDSAGDEYRAAAEVGDDPQFLLDAAAAYAKKPSYEKAHAAYRAYLEKVPLGPKSDDVRAKVADLQRTIDKAAEDERNRRLRESLTGPTEAPAVPRYTFKRGWIVVGGAMILTGVVADLAAPNGDNGKLDASDFAPIALYGLGSAAVLRGVF